MSDMKKMDEFLKNSFSDYSPEVPPHIWENIAAERKKKKPGIFWLNEKKALLILAAVLLTSAGVYLTLNQKNNSQNIAHENTGSRQETGNTVTAAVLQDKNKTGVDATAGNTNEPLAENKEPGTTQNDKATAVVVKPAADNAYSKAVINKDKNATTGAGNNDNTGVISQTKNKRRQLNYKKRITQTTTASSDPSSNDMDANAGNDITIDQSVQNEFGLPFLPGSRDKILFASENNFVKQTIQLNPTALKIKEDCPGAVGNNYYIEAYISPDYVIKKYSDTANSTLVERRKQSLSIQSAFSAGIRYTRVFNNGMSIRAGINYSQVNEKFSYAKDNVVQIIYVINNAGDTTDSYFVRGTRYKNSYNHYHTIDVPVVIGYEMGNGNFHANINAGAVINIYSWQKGETLDNNGAPVSITTNKDDNPYQYKTNVGVGFTGGVSLYYKLNDRFHVMAEPYFRYNFSPMNREALSIQEKFTTIGLRLGIRMDIK